MYGCHPTKLLIINEDFRCFVVNILIIVQDFLFWHLKTYFFELFCILTFTIIILYNIYFSFKLLYNNIKLSYKLFFSKVLFTITFLVFIICIFFTFIVNSSIIHNNFVQEFCIQFLIFYSYFYYMYL